ncbi:MAG: hypothetical protein P4M11_09525 [Candidatus Pacebacteria bacterium]|nr:hypothetical protein [Candidatus Paceibacterota bacterium]
MSSEMYVISSRSWLIRDTSDEARIEQLDFHLKTGDYFRVLGTILGFLEETLEGCSNQGAPELIPLELDVIRDTKKNLDYLHENYRITPKEDA